MIVIVLDREKLHQERVIDVVQLSNEYEKKALVLTD